MKRKKRKKRKKRGRAVGEKEARNEEGKEE